MDYISNTTLVYSVSYGDHLGKHLRNMLATNKTYSLEAGLTWEQQIYFGVLLLTAFVISTLVLFFLFLSLSYLVVRSCGTSLDIEKDITHRNRFDTIIPPITLS